MWWNYYRRLLKRAFTKSIGPVDLWMGLVGAALGIADHFWPARQLMSAVGWQVPIWALTTVMAVRLLLAPYWLAKEDAARIAELEAKSKRPDQKAQLMSFYIEAGELLTNFPGYTNPEQRELRLKDVNDFIEKASAWIGTNMGPGSQSRFLDLGSEGQEGNATEWKLKLRRQNLARLIESDHW